MSFIAILTTRGRTTGRAHSKPLKAVKYNGDIYFTRHRPDSDWYKNAAANPDVSVEIDGVKAAGRASVIHDRDTLDTISALKYPGSKRAEERRVGIKVTLCV